MSKYGAVRTVVDGITFASKLEANRYRQLLILERAGLIRSLKLQPDYEIHPAFTDNEGKRHRKISYVGDFQYVENGQVICEDTKGRETPTFKLKAKLFRARYPGIKFVIVRMRPDDELLLRK